ncbi:MAG: hypothetical protein ACW98F_19460 [Candidatus Hodarchaeales archaeon]|jgi:hypothetical protein
MKNYFVLYHASNEAIEKMRKDWSGEGSKPEEQKESMEAWMVWAKKIGKSLVDMGTPLSGGQKITMSGDTPSDKNVLGYSILQAENIDEAKGLLKEHPHLAWDAGCEIEVHESIPTPE